MKLPSAEGRASGKVVRGVRMMGSEASQLMLFHLNSTGEWLHPLKLEPIKLTMP